MRELVIDKPSQKQEQFLRADRKHIAFGGARGGGKSWAVRVKAVLLCLRYQGIKCLIVRRTYPELQNNHIQPLRLMLGDIAQYNGTEKQFRFQNGSTIKFGYCKSDSDLMQYQGAEYDVIFIDEATQLSESQLKVIEACMRGVNDFPKRVYYTCNPGGQSHQYIKRLFVDRIFEGSEREEDYEFIQSLVTDNQALLKSQPDYVEQLESLPEKLKRAWLYGDWNVFEGQFFEELRDNPEHYEDRCFTHVIAPFEVPSNWEIYRSFDWGYAKPFSCAWWAVDTDGVIYRILELYGCTKEPNTGVKLTPQEVFAEVHRIETEHRWLRDKKIHGIADPAIWDAQTGESIADTASKYRVYFSPGDHQRIAGWMQVHYRLQFDDNGRPMMYVFNTCKGFMRTMPLLQFSDTKVEDLDTNQEDHIADEVRYMCMSRPIKPIIKREDKYNSSANKMILDIEKEDLPRYEKRGRMEVLE